jgi:hypothetical protein
MAKTVTAKFASLDAARNAHEDLIDLGYPDETVFLNRESGDIKVMTSDEGEKEAREVLDRHRPTEITARDS